MRPILFDEDPFYKKHLTSQHQTESFLVPNEQTTDVNASKTSTGSDSETCRMTEKILQSNSVPVDLTSCETEPITIQGHSGIWVNKSDERNWNSFVPINQYPVNDDYSPTVLRKTTNQQINYTQEYAIRYLRPPTPQQPGDILIVQDKAVLPPPAPPFVIRQQPPRPSTPEPLILREFPPKLPEVVQQQTIRVSGKKLPPPPRKVIIERLAPLPPKPQPIIIERWLGYKEQKRRVIFKPAPVEMEMPKEKNIIIQWESPKVNIVKEFRDLGVVYAHPSEYIQRFGSTLKHFDELPDFAKNLHTPTGLVFAEDQFKHRTLQTFPYELEGDVHALKMFDLEKEGLSAYSCYLNKCSDQTSTFFTEKDESYQKMEMEDLPKEKENLTCSTDQSQRGELNEESLIYQVFGSANRTHDYYITKTEAMRILCEINEKLCRRHDEERCQRFISSLKNTKNGLLNLEEFKSAVVKAVYK